MHIKTVIIAIALAFIATTVASPTRVYKRNLNVNSSNVQSSGTSYVATGFCDSDLNCSSHGNCNYFGTACICDSKYVTHDASPGVYCNYAQKDRALPFAIEFVFGWETGAGYFIMGYDGYGAGQLVLFWGSIIFLCFALGTNAWPVVVISVIGLVASFGWWIASVVIIGTGSLKDQNGVTTAWGGDSWN